MTSDPMMPSPLRPNVAPSPHCLIAVLLGIVSFAWIASAAAADDPAAQPAAIEPTAAIAENGSIFPDKALEAAVRNEVFAKRDNDEPITVDDVAKISRVVAIGQGVKQLEGLQHCKSLMLIDFSDNEIKDLAPIANLRRLQSVTLTNNQITDISPLKDLIAMQLIDLSGNQIESIEPLSAMANLRTLYAADNRIKSLDPIAKLGKIWSLDVAGNQLTDLQPVAGMTWLTTLEISDNQIRSLDPITSLTDLDMLIMPGNPIESIAPLVSMCEKDAKADRRFAPYLDVYLSPTQAAQPILKTESEALKIIGVEVHEYERTKR